MKIRVVELYKCYLENNSLSNFFKAKGIQHDLFYFFKSRSDKQFYSKLEIIIIELKCIFLLVNKVGGFKNTRTICFGGHLSLLLVSKLFGRFLGRDFHLYVYNFFFHSLQNRALFRLLLHYLLSAKHTTLIAQSISDIDYYVPLTSNKVHFIPYCEDPEYPMEKFEVPEGDFLFTGGYSNRDYDLILKSAKLFRSTKFVVVISKLNDNSIFENCPGNLIKHEEIDISYFNFLMHKSLGVIIPLKENVGASGQMLCLGAMKMSKPIIYCNIPSINFYFDGKECGIPYSIGDLDSLCEGIKKLFSPGFNLELMGKQAYNNYLNNYTLEKRNTRLSQLINQPME